MSWIWEGYDPASRLVCGSSVSPYIEMLVLGEVNPLLRFAEIFDAYSEIRRSHTDQIFVNELDNMVFHYLAQLDRLFGLTRKQVLMDLMQEAINNGAFGDTAKQLWNVIDDTAKEAVISTLTEKYLGGSRDDYYVRAVKRAFDGMELVYEKSTKRYYLYLGAKKSEQRKKTIELIGHLFWKFDEQLPLVVWQYHYGIIGYDETMRISKITVV